MPVTSTTKTKIHADSASSHRATLATLYKPRFVQVGSRWYPESPKLRVRVRVSVGLPFGRVAKW